MKSASPDSGPYQGGSVGWTFPSGWPRSVGTPISCTALSVKTELRSDNFFRSIVVSRNVCVPLPEQSAISHSHLAETAKIKGSDAARGLMCLGLRMIVFPAGFFRITETNHIVGNHKHPTRASVAQRGWCSGRSRPPSRPRGNRNPENGLAPSSGRCMLP